MRTSGLFSVFIEKIKQLEQKAQDGLIFHITTGLHIIIFKVCVCLFETNENYYIFE